MAEHSTLGALEPHLNERISAVALEPYTASVPNSTSGVYIIGILSNCN